MAFPNPPKTWTAAAVLTAAQLNAELRDALNALLPLNLVAWTTFTPTLTQTGAVTKTVTYAKYTRFGNCVLCEMVLTVTGTGTANSKVTASLPVTAAGTSTQLVGGGNIVDSSAVTNNPGFAVLDSTTTVALLDSTAATGGVRQGQTGATFAVALANTDVVQFSLFYEV